MSDAHRRPKKPQQVRRKLLAAAADLCAVEGPAALTLDAVSKAVGVSKGGLLHHFPGRDALIDALFEDLVGRFDTAIEAAIAADPVAEGRFTRAYVACSLDLGLSAEGEGWRGLTAAILGVPSLRARWHDWVAAKAERFGATDGAPRHQLARFAADGVWLADLLGSHDLDAATRAAIRVELAALAAPAPPASGTRP
ncbi:TetR/AcrR family transcriptional regulator [Ensifer soli]|uniref:TetR/AcrR family transcriptional regulator n=1 Tax=Ciceribacter sp. sgz301302 TaxID=3342379 RepID=UPI0035B82497